MAKIVLDTITGGYDLSIINDNFNKVEAEFQNKVLYRDNPVGEANTLQTDVDANGKHIYNLPEPLLASQAARLQDVQNAISGGAANLITFTPYGSVGSTNVQAAIQEILDEDVTASQLAASSGSSLVGFIQAGVGAVLRTLESKLRDFVNVKDFGAVGDGVADDTVAITAALTAAMTSNKTLYFPEGTYLLLTWTTFTATSEIRITGKDALIKGPVTPDVAKRFLKPQAKFKIENLKFDRWSHIARVDDVDTGDPSGSVFDSNTVSGCVNQPLLISRPFNSLRVTNNFFFNNTGGVVVYLGINTDAGQGNWKNAVVSNNTFQDNSGTGSVSTAAILNNGIYSTIVNNRIRNITSDTGEAWGIYTKNVHSVVSNNVISGVNATGVQQDVVGISIKGANRATINSGTQGYSVVVTGNMVHSIGQQGVKGSGIRVQQSDVLVSGNRSEDCGVFNITVDDSNACTDVIVSNNMTRQFNFSSSAAALNISSTGGRFTISNNIIQGGVKAISLGAVSGTLSSVRISDNSILFGTGGGGVVFDNFGTLTAVSITNNTFDAASTGVCIKTGTLGTITNSEVDGNNFSLAVSAGSTVKTAGINIAFRNNRGYVTRLAGTSSVPTGGAGLVVNHGLASTPVSVVATPISQAATVQVHNITSTQFTLIHNLGGSVSVCWNAVSSEEFN